MSAKSKEIPAQNLLVEEETEEYLTYTIHKLVIIVKDNAQLHIDNLMSGKPKENPPPPGGG
jgi:hypothetical protein